MSNKSLLPPNATKFLKDLEAVGNLDLKTANRFVYNPDLADENILPWLAWSLSIDSWNDSWPVDVKRNMIRNTILLHKIKGTKAAVKKVLEIVGIKADITEWWQKEPKSRPYTFELVAVLNNNMGTSKQTQKELIRLINNVKPVRCHFEFKLAARFGSNLFYQTGFKIKNNIRILLKEQPLALKSSFYITTVIKLTIFKKINFRI